MPRNFKYDEKKAIKEYDDKINNSICPICSIGVLKEKSDQRPKLFKCHLCGYAREIPTEDKPSGN